MVALLINGPSPTPHTEIQARHLYIKSAIDNYWNVLNILEEFWHLAGVLQHQVLLSSGDFSTL
jgi:hypothetical protein